jgi:multidrug transporter EmrE-like cation transporter
MHQIIAGTLLTLVEGIGNYALKKYAIGSPWGYLSIGVMIYNALAFLLVWLFQHVGFAILNATWDATSNIFTMAVGYLVFKESYTVREWFGMALVTLGLVFINGSKAKP